nr:PLxRFG domain-containing protein [Comamonas thiooxydans]
MTGGKAGKALEGAGVRFKEAREIAEGWHSDVTKAKKAEFLNADGVAGKAAVALSNPSLIAMAVGESLGAMGAGGAIGRGAMAATRLGQMGAKGAAISGAVGEGVVGAGSAAEQIRQQTDDGELTAKQAALAAGTGLATGALGFAGNKVANRLGIGDADMMLAQGTKGMAKDAAERATAAAVNPLAQSAHKSILRQMGEGAITEGVLEELPQSVSEQILQNEALGKSWSEGLDDAIVMGILSGGAMGAGAAGYRGFKDKQIDDAAANARSAAANAPGAANGQDQAAAAAAVSPAAWTTSAGAAAEMEPGTAPASPANAPNLDYETLPGAAPEAQGNEIDFTRDFAAPDWGTELGAAGQQPAATAAPELTPSQAMGLDPNAGALSKAAAMAVDSGASLVVQPQVAPMAEQQAAPQVPAGVDPDTGEVSLQAQMDELKSRIAFMQQQGAAQGWDGNRAAQRNALQTQLTRLELQAAGGQERGASTTGAPAPVQLTGINQILAKQIPDMNEQELQQAIAHYGPTHKRTKKLEKALQALAQKPLTAIESGANGNVFEADQAQQVSAQPAQAGAAQAGQDAGQGVGNGTTPTANPGAQEQGASLAKAQAQVTQAAGAAQAAVGKAAQIAREGNAEREAQRQLDASERWTRMTTAERQAVAATAPGLNAIARKNVHTRAWPDLGEKIREKLLDSLVAPLVESTSKTPSAIENAAKPAPNAVSGDALPKPAAQPVGDEKPFTAETGTLGIPRAEMPQVPTANHGGLVKHLKAQGISHETTTVDAAQLKPTQAEYSPSKVEAAKTATGDRAVIVSRDGHIIDGHHQAVAAAEEGKQVKAIVLDAPVEQALAAVKASPSANIEAASERYKYPAIGNTKPAQYELQKAAVDYLNGDVGKSELVTKAAHALRDGVTLGQVHALYMRTSDFTTGDGYAAVRASSPEMAKALDIVQDGKVSKWAAVKQIAALGLKGSQLKAVTQDGYVFGKDFSDADIEVMQAEVAPAAPVAAPKSVPERMKEAKAAKEAASANAAAPATKAASVQEQPDSGDFPLSEAVQSYSGISHSGRSRADGDKQAFDKFMESARAAAEKLATTDAQRDALAAATDSLRADYLKQYRSLMNVRAGAYSGFVAGRGNLNSKQANGRNSALDKAMERFDSWAGDNADRVSKAVLAARTPEQVKADRDAATAQIQEKADKKAANLKATLLKLLSFKKGDNMPYGKGAILTKVSYDRDGYPSSLTFKMADGSPLTDDKLDLLGTLKDKGETLEQAKARIRGLVDEVRAENPELNRGIGAIRATASDKAAKPKSVPAKIAEAQAARADYFTPGNIVKSYGNTFDRVIAYSPPDDQGRWSVTVQEVERQGDAWVAVPNEGERTHSTQPTARDLKTGPVERVASETADGARFRREAAETAAGAAFDVASFLQSMDEGKPTGAAAAPAPTTNVRPSYSSAARAEAVRAVKGTADAIRQAWANGPEVIVAFDMQDSVVPESARRADLKQRSGGARGAPEGFYYQGKVYLMASKLKTPNDAARVLFHEALGHHGLRGLFGKDLGLILNQVATMRKAEVEAKIAEYGLRRVSRLDRRTAAEEVLAEMAQNTPQIGFVRRAVAAIRTWLRANVPGFKSLVLTDAELIRNFILPARAWVERGTVADMSQDIAFSRTSATSMPDAIIGSTLGSASSHPDYAAAKGGDIEAAVRLAMDLVTPDLVAKVKAAIGDSKPLVVPVAAEEASGRNKIPRAAAEVLAHRLGLKAANGIVQANRARRTGMDGLDRIFAPVDFAGAVEPKPYLLVDDTLTQGGTLAALASHIREGGGTVAGVIALTGKQYSAKIQPSPETLASLRQKHGDLENEYRAATGYGFDALTESEARYLARYEPADRLRDRISDEGRRGREREDQSNPGQADPDADEGLRFSRSRLSEIRDSALDQLSNAFTHEGKVSLWDKSVGTMRHLAERAPSFKPVYESAQQNIDDVSMLANDAADMAPRILPRVESLGDLKKKPVSAADNKAVARPLFEGTLIWARDENGKPTLVDDLQKRYANLSAHNKAAMLLKHGKIDAGVLAMWQGLPVAQFEKLINSRFENKMLKAGIVWTDAELQAQFGTDANQISLYREARAAIDRSIDMTARTDMLRVVGEKYEPMRDAVLAQPSVEAAAQLLLDTLEQDAKADPDSRDRLAGYMQLINRRLDTAVDLQQGGYAPLSRFGRYTVDVVDANGERLYFGMYETARDSNRAKMQLEHEFKGATVTTGTMSAEAYKLFAGVTPETLEQFGEMLGLKSEGNEAQDKAFQEFLKLTKNNHSAMKRLIHRKGIAGFSEDVGRVVANFVYSNARAGAMGLNAGKMETAIGKIPKEQGELKDLAMGLRDYIRDPQEEGQAVRGMLFAQYLGGSIASAFVNTTQPFAVTLPWLSQYGGMKKAGAQLARALKDMGRSVADKGFKYEADLAKALQAAEDDGVVSPQEIHQLMAQARGAGMLRSGDGTKAGDLRAKAGNLWEQGKVLWGQPFALAEQFNRRSTFIASYRIAKDQGMADPAAFARKAVLETQFVYSKANKPKWARGAVGGTLFTFKTYSVSYLELMQRMWNQGGPEGKRAVGWALAMLLLMSGAGGVPFMEDAEDLIDGAGQMMGYNISAKQWRKEFLAAAVGKELAEFMEQGLSGLPGAPIDVSGRLGMGNLLPGTGLFLDKPNRERDMTEIIGPAGDLVARGFSGARDVIKGVVNGDAATAGKGVLEWAPTAVRNLAKGLDMVATGMYRDTKGYKVIDTTLAEAAAKAIGFQPKSVAEVQEANSFMQRSKSFYTQTSSEIKAQWADALFRKDEAAVQRVRGRLADWNRDNPEQPIVVKMPDVWKRVREMGKDRSDRIADTAPKALREQMREQIRSIG